MNINKQMVLSNALKVLSADVCHRFSLEYAPSESVRKSFLLPRVVTVFVEVFPIKELSPFSRDDPLYAIDGFLVVENGHPRIRPCTEESSFVDLPLSSATDSAPASVSSIRAALSQSLADLVQIAIRKAEVAFFPVPNPSCLRSSTVLIKLNRTKQALLSIEEEMGEIFGMASVIPYAIYEVLIRAATGQTSPSLSDRIVQLSYYLDGSLESVLENRIANSLVEGVAHTPRPVPARILSMHTHVVLSSEKEALFLFLLAEALGRGSSGTRCALLTLAREAFACPGCSSRPGIKNTLQSMVALETGLDVKRSVCNHLIDEYIHTKSSLPEPELSIRSAVGEYAGKERRGIYIPSFASEHCLSGKTTVFTEGRVEISHSIPLSAIEVEYPESISTTSLKEGVCVVGMRRRSLIAPISAQKGKSVFFIGRTSTLVGLTLHDKDRCFTHKASVQIQVLKAPISKKIFSHRFYIAPVSTSRHTNETDALLEIVRKKTGHPATLLSASPLVARVPFQHASHSLYLDIRLFWSTLPVIRVEESEHQYEILPLFKPVAIQDPAHPQSSPVVVKKSFLLKKVPGASRKLFWFFTDQSKGGVILL
ncbi:hypothetical protein NEDG_00064 [Nematocida displodere]|uniref:Uncharacterized protein n=1 Tax=Nematocida displodere TaxID=1805483 RepID=A0A177EKT0_9MICR|nr:hypothetical protein NEDG_00064 [Nematocida displodere]